MNVCRQASTNDDDQTQTLGIGQALFLQQDCQTPASPPAFPPSIPPAMIPLYRVRIMLSLPGQGAVELVRFPYSPADVDLAAYTRDLSPAWTVTIERTQLDTALVSPRPNPSRHYVASDRERTALPTAALGPVIDRYIDAAGQPVAV